jgi:uncharacterized membrane protein
VTLRAPNTPEAAFLVIGALAGVVFILVTPPFGGADEPAHWYRAYQVSEGTFRAEHDGDRVGGLLPTSLRLSSDERPWRGGSAPLRAQVRSFLDFRNTVVYAPVPYLPHAVAIAAGRRAHLHPLSLFYLARTAGLVAALTLSFLAIRITPLGKRTFLLLALTPVAIRQMSLVSVDSVTNGVSLLFVAMCLRAALAGTPFRARDDRGTLGVWSVVMSLSKIAYVPLSGLSLLPRPGRTETRRIDWGGALVVIGLGVAGVVAWMWFIGDLYAAQRIAPDANPTRQAAIIFGDPVRYGRVLVTDLLRNGTRYVWQGLGYGGTLSPGFAWPHVALLIGIALLDGNPGLGLGRWDRGLIVVVAAVTYALVTTLNYLAWTSVGSASITFVQGRYYIPIAPLLLLLVSSRRLASRVPGPRLTSVAAAGAACFAALAIWNLFQRWHP